ncbi:MAG: hypothetical protein OXT67_10830 [Zetaproteobacteria bacterium]|nr:hypothetical protein [Zetaproteobacteria bacterium]
MLRVVLWCLLGFGVASVAAAVQSPQTFGELVRNHDDFVDLTKLRLADGRSLLIEHNPDPLPAAGFPRRILLLRHAEKSGKKQDKQINAEGWQRAFALAVQMSTDPFYPQQLDEIYAAASFADHPKSLRSIETAMPLAWLTQTQMYAGVHQQDYAAMAELLKTRADRQIVVFWEHKHLHNLAKALGVPVSEVPYYPDHVYDQIWEVTYTTDAVQPPRPRLRVYQQNLLYVDALRQVAEGFTLEDASGVHSGPSVSDSIFQPYQIKFHWGRHKHVPSLCPAATRASDSQQPGCQDFYLKVTDLDQDQVYWLPGSVWRKPGSLRLLGAPQSPLWLLEELPNLLPQPAALQPEQVQTTCQVFLSAEGGQRSYALSLNGLNDGQCAQLNEDVRTRFCGSAELAYLGEAPFYGCSRGHQVDVPRRAEPPRWGYACKAFATFSIPLLLSGWMGIKIFRRMRMHFSPTRYGYQPIPTPVQPESAV